MGEASKAVSREFAAAHDEIPWSDIAKVRDRLSHHDHRVDPGQLWTVASVDVPAVAEGSSSRAEVNRSAGRRRPADFLHRSCTGFSGTARNWPNQADSTDGRTAPELGKRNPQDWPDGSWAT